MSSVVENRATIEAFWWAWNEERLDDPSKCTPPTLVFVTSIREST
jgi:hypothetical protein